MADESSEDEPKDNRFFRTGRRSMPYAQINAQDLEVPPQEEIVRQKMEAFYDIDKSQYYRTESTLPHEGIAMLSKPNKLEFNHVAASIRRERIKSLKMFDSDVDINNEQELVRELYRYPVVSVDKVIEKELVKPRLYLKEAGRGSCVYEGVEIVTEDNEIYQCINTKGDGSIWAIDWAIRNNLPSHIYSRKDHRFTTVKPEDRGTGSGVLSISEATSDCNNSMDLKSIGIDVRLPLDIHLLDTIEVDGKRYSSDEFINELANGDERERPCMVTYATHSAFKFSDVQGIINEAVATGNLAAMQEVVFQTIKGGLAFTNRPDMVNTLQKYQGILDQEQLSVEDLYIVMVDLTQMFFEYTGQNFGKMHSHGFLHRNPHSQNQTFLSEISDNVTVAKVGFRGSERIENSKNLPDFLSEMRRIENNNIPAIYKALELFRETFLSDQSLDFSEQTLVERLKQGYGRYVNIDISGSFSEQYFIALGV